ncbi:hypothetical protein C4K22_3704 [Pseudomonas chlororaphis subsp. aurantiaca]|uniref:UvrD-helicase domain-containing protein n=1 Tax=Pseudomonas chlororaphis TaxID=587753 RepID=UPI000F58757B|nr:UvrD-helicase domain-containing protein [Pseudomonas chlororaphis]AZD36445.1 hypothetical protein C4K22_3704 [Pseudomonas chlororaphis subsp. aurantiaca]AZD42783.1 hypothetical protein C4K21_3711 [Pseudomonas chlororaphis subsp. aurantiaca]
MPEPRDIWDLTRRAIIAPAGHGKTELLARASALGRRTLILTHTHAGVHALRGRLNRLQVPPEIVSVDTIASWANKYVQAFPRLANFPPANPRGAQWNQIYESAAHILQSRVVQTVIRASYDRILIDEYQDCELHQHGISMALSSIVPTVVFGDPMQGIFEFVDTRIRWSEHIENSFTTAYELTEPHRWNTANAELGRWISFARQQLMTGQPLDLRTGPVNYIQCNTAFEMGLFFNGFEQREGTTAAIHCRRGVCNRLAQSTNGAYQAIEEIAAARLMEFAAAWDGAQNPNDRASALRSILNDTMTQANADGEVEAEITVRIATAWLSLRQSGSPTHALEVISCERAHPQARTYRAELLNDAKRALKDLEAGRRVNLVVACEAVRHRLSHTGRAPTVRTISTPLLLKGLEYDHVLIPDATHFLAETAAAKLFYVAISRARWSLTIASRSPVLQFPIPNL